MEPPGEARAQGDFERAAWWFFKEFNGQPPHDSLHDFLAHFERAIVFNTLAEMDGCQRRAARFLKLKNTTLNRKVKILQIHFVKTPV
jgi:DNA-binding NtrC family response regulator